MSVCVAVISLSACFIITFIRFSVTFSFFYMTDQSVFPNTWVFRQALPSSSEASTRCHVSPISWCYTWHLEDASEEDGRAGWKAQVFGKTLLSFIKVKRSYCLKSKGNRTFNALFVYFILHLYVFIELPFDPKSDFLSFHSLFLLLWLFKVKILTASRSLRLYYYYYVLAALKQK